MQNRKYFKRELIPANHFIKASEVRCIDANGDNIGITALKDAIRLAEESSLDLVQIAAGQNNIPICRITDYSKFKYEKAKKSKEAARKQREGAVKLHEIKFKPSTGLNDLKTKALKTQKFLDNGDRVKVSVIFKGREITHKEVGYDAFNTFIEMVSNVHVVDQPTLQKKVLTAIVVKKNDSDE